MVSTTNIPQKKEQQLGSTQLRTDQARLESIFPNHLEEIFPKAQLGS